MNNLIVTELILPDNPAAKLVLPTRTEPVLARSVQGQLVVLFRGRTDGIVLYNIGGPTSIGHVSNTWEDINKEDCWTVLPKGSKVILTVK